MADSKAQQEAEASGLELVEDDQGLMLRIARKSGYAGQGKDKEANSCSGSGKGPNRKRKVVEEPEEYIRGDFTKMIPRLRKNNMEHELLIKAAHLKNFIGTDGHPAPVVLDATAGMGEDSLLLAAAGFQVELYEKDPVIAALLEDALTRAKAVPELAGAASRMHLHREDSIEAMRGVLSSHDIIYLDPMFPERVKSAKVKKKFQLLHYLERPCENEEELLQAAVDAKPQKIVIKRPVKGPYLAGRKPDYSYSGKAVRYDCLINL